MRKPRLLWVGDAVIKSGFSRVGHSVCEHLRHAWDVHYLGIGYTGDPHNYPYPIHPARKYVKGDMFGISRFQEICDSVEPDVVLINSDSFVVCGFLDVAKKLEKRPIIAAYSPVDTPGVKSEIIRQLHSHGLDLFISYTEFGAMQFRKSGWLGMTTVIPHGVDFGFYKAHDKEECREKLAPGIPKGALLIGNVNRNQPRKRLDLTLIYFAEWLNRGGDGYLWLHCAKKDAGWDLVELAKQLGVSDRVFMPGVKDVEDMPDEILMPFFYSMFDIFATTSLGEGWGLTVMEAMSCSVPVIAPRWSALEEWAEPAAHLVRCSSVEVLSGYHAFGIGGVVDQEEFIDALDELASSVMLREEMGRLGRELVTRPEYKWKNIAQRFNVTLAALINIHGSKVKKAASEVQESLAEMTE